MFGCESKGAGRPHSGLRGSFLIFMNWKLADQNPFEVPEG
jgi:hypothetical protein